MRNGIITKLNRILLSSFLLIFSCSQNKAEEADAGLDSGVESDGSAGGADRDGSVDGNSTYDAGRLIWVKSAGGPSSDRAFDISINKDNLIAITGSCSYDAVFDPGGSNPTTIENDSMFTALYRDNGDLEWVKTEVNYLHARGVSIQENGSVIVTGEFWGKQTIGEGEENETIIESQEREDVFIIKYNADGTLAWAKAIGGQDTDWGTDIDSDKTKKIVIAGSYLEDITLGNGEINETYFYAESSFDIFIAKYNSQGSLIWARTAGAYAGDIVESISVDDDGSVLITGYFDGEITFSKGEINEVTLYAEGISDIFIAKYSSEGQFEWARSAGSPDDNDLMMEPESANSIATMNDGSYLITGTFWGSATFGKGEPDETILTSAGNQDMFVARYSKDGNLIWAKSAGGEGGMDIGWGVAGSTDGYVYVTGTFDKEATWGYGEENETTIASFGYADIFIAQYDSNGSFLWATGLGSNADFGDFSWGIDVLPEGAPVITGHFGEILWKKEKNINQEILKSNGMEDIFLIKMDP